MFCERCGTRQETGSARPGGSGGAFARRVLTAVGLPSGAVPDGEHFLRLCLNCRGYTCPVCWNEDVGLCQTCVPLPEVVVELPPVEAGAAPPAEPLPLTPTEPPITHVHADWVEPTPSADPLQASHTADWEPRPAVEPALAVEAEPEPAVEAEPEQAEPEAMAEPMPEPMPALAVEPEPEAEPEQAEPEAMAEPMPALAVEAEPEPAEPEQAEPEAMAEPMPEPMPALAAEAEPEPAEPEAMAEPMPEPMPALAAEAEPEAEPEQADPKADRAPLLPTLPLLRPIRPRIEFDVPPPLGFLAAREQHSFRQPAPLSAPPPLPAGLFEQLPTTRPCRGCHLTLSSRARFCRRCGSAQD